MRAEIKRQSDDGLLNNLRLNFIPTLSGLCPVLHLTITNPNKCYYIKAKENYCFTIGLLR